jgi:hypothetical protein
MPKTTLTKNLCSTQNAGKIVTLVLADGSNGNQVLANSENLHITVLNTDSATHTVTILRPKVSNTGYTNDVGPITVPAAVTGKPGMWDSSSLPSDWFKDTSGYIGFTFDETPTGVYIAVVDMIPAPSAV